MSQPLFVFGGRRWIHFGMSNCPHLSKALALAYGPLHVVLFPVLWNVQSCVQPAKARRAIYSKAGGVCTSRSEVHFRKASRPILRSLLERLSCCKCEQCAKVDPKISLISVRKRSTNCSRVQRSQAAGPIQVKFDGRESETIPASKKQHSGRHRVRLVGSCSVFQNLVVATQCTSQKPLAETAPAGLVD